MAASSTSAGDRPADRGFKKVPELFSKIGKMLGTRDGKNRKNAWHQRWGATIAELALVVEEELIKRVQELEAEEIEAML